MIVVDDIDIMPPRKMQLMVLRCSIYPTPNPAIVMPTMIIRAVMMAELPEFMSFLKENSRPSENMSTTMPRSAHTSMFSRLDMEGR